MKHLAGDGYSRVGALISGDEIDPLVIGAVEQVMVRIHPIQLGRTRCGKIGEIVKPLLEMKDATKLAAQEAALAAPKLPVRISKREGEAMELFAAASPAITDGNTDSVLQWSRHLSVRGQKLHKLLSPTMLLISQDTNRLKYHA